MLRVKGIFKTAAMHITLLLALIQHIFASPHDGSRSRTSLYGEIVRDLINYRDEEPSLIARGRFSENIDETFLFNFSMLRDINRDRYDYTWNIGLTGLNDHLDFWAGNYNLGFGSGLIMGRKKFISPDPFRKTLTVSRENSVIPSTGSNPSAAFYGATARIYSTGDDYSAGFVPFFSAQKRYITEDELSDRYIASSLPTLEGRTTGNSKYRESSYILNYGGMFWLSFIECLTMQTYGFTTELRDPERKELRWEYDTEKATGIRRCYSSGLFIEYADDVISFFIEPAFSSRVYHRRVTGRALMWGFGAKNRVLLFTVRGKNCDPGFRADYSSGDRNPENIFEITGSVKLMRSLEFGASFYSEKNINPSSGNSEAGGTVREEGYASIKPFRWIEFDLNAARSRSYRDNPGEEKFKVSSSILFSMPWNLYLRVRSDMQRENSSGAYLHACELKYLFFDYFTFSAGYTDIRVEGETGIYAAIIPAAEAELSSTLYKESARGGAVKLKYRRENLSFHARGSLVETAEGREMTAESSLGFIF